MPRDTHKSTLGVAQWAGRSDNSHEFKRRYQWSEVSTIGDIPGIYAWYYLPEITQFDISRLIESVRDNVSSCDRATAQKQVETFLEQFIFKFFTEEPYQTILRGALKPSYRGELYHCPDMSSNLIDRLVDDPERLVTVKAVLEKSAPDFASPIYIGMSEKLGSRLQKHRKLIEKYRAKLPRVTVTPDTERAAQNRDQSFARQIAEREINPQRLFVIVEPIETSANHYVDLENILNRIHYPLFGRN